MMQVHSLKELADSRLGGRAARAGAPPAGRALLGPVAFVALVVPWFAVGHYALLAFHQAPGAPRSVWAGVYTEAQAQRGKVVYAEHCASCHGDNLTGGEAPLIGTGFVSVWDGLSVADLVRRTRTTMPPEAPAGLTRQQYVDSIAYLLQLHRFPPGQEELPAGDVALTQIRLEWTKPSDRPD